MDHTARHFLQVPSIISQFMIR